MVAAASEMGKSTSQNQRPKSRSRRLIRRSLRCHNPRPLPSRSASGPASANASPTQKPPRLLHLGPRALRPTHPYLDRRHLLSRHHRNLPSRASPKRLPARARSGSNKSLHAQLRACFRQKTRLLFCAPADYSLPANVVKSAAFLTALSGRSLRAAGLY